jgi:hypothetical protein
MLGVRPIPGKCGVIFLSYRLIRAILKRPDGVGSWTYLDIPVDVSASFGVKGQVKVKGTINGQLYRSSALLHGDGTHYPVAGQAILDGVGVPHRDEPLKANKPAPLIE